MPESHCRILIYNWFRESRIPNPNLTESIYRIPNPESGTLNGTVCRNLRDLGILNSDLESYYMFQRNLLAKRRTWLKYGEKIRELQVKNNIKLGYYNFRIRFVDGCYSLFI